MAKIYLLSSPEEYQFVHLITAHLVNRGHTVRYSTYEEISGKNWQDEIGKNLKDSDIFVPFLSKMERSSPVLDGIRAASAYSEASERLLIVPIILGDFIPPYEVAQYGYFQTVDRDPAEITERISEKWATFVGLKVAQSEVETKRSELIEVNASSYITEATEALVELEKRNRFRGNSWYAAGFFALVMGVYFAETSVHSLMESSSKSWIDFAVLVVRSLIVVGLLAACSKYAFTLGKSFLSESLKSADRLHAISFGKFYLKVYGHTATWPEVKEVFQHWNIDRNSTFAGQTTAEFDPKIAEYMVEMAKVLAPRRNEKAAKD